MAGRGGRECAKADGRELWVLGELYEVAGMRDWLLDEGLQGGNFGAAYEFWLVQAYRGLLEFVYLGERFCKGGPCHVCFACDDGLPCLCHVCFARDDASLFIVPLRLFSCVQVCVLFSSPTLYVPVA